MSIPEGNARKVAIHAQGLWESVLDAEMFARNALEAAKKDYEHNDEGLDEIVGAIRMISRVVAAERGIWERYARARGE